MTGRIRSVAQGFMMAGREAPGTLMRLFMLNAVGGLAPASMLYLQKTVIDLIADFDEGGRGLGAFLGSPWKLIAAGAVFVTLDLVLDGVEQIIQFEASTFCDRILAGAKRFVQSHLQKIRGIALFETPEFATRLKLAIDAIPSIDYFGNALHYTLFGLLGAIPLIAICATLGWWVPLVTVAVALPSAFVQHGVENRGWSLKEAQSEKAKQMDVYERMLTLPDHAKETRLLGVNEVLQKRWQETFGSALRKVIRLRGDSQRKVLVWSVVSAAGVSATFLYVVDQGMRGTLSAGDLALYIGSVFQLRRSLQYLSRCVVDVFAQGLRMEAIGNVLSMDDGLRDRPRAARCDSTAGLTFEEVTFRYPGSEMDAVRKVSFGVSQGRSVALVGANGSGKTTLVKLACRLYDPDAGTVSWNGRPLPEIPVDGWRASIAALMQDHSRFPVSAFDNVWFGNVAAPNDDLDGVRAAARQSGIEGHIERLPTGWGTPLSKELAGGRDLSGGEWQRLALARAFYRSEAALIVLDEPTYGVDPAAEGDIWERVRSWIAGRTALIVSHRLGLTRFVDEIVVMARGSVVERGDHASLMVAGGLYARMFETQARPYRGDRP